MEINIYIHGPFQVFKIIYGTEKQTKPPFSFSTACTHTHTFADYLINPRDTHTHTQILMQDADMERHLEKTAVRLDRTSPLIHMLCFAPLSKMSPRARVATRWSTEHCAHG